MKLRWLIPLLLIAQALCQSTSVTGQVTDASGQAWSNGSFTFTFAGPPNVNWTGGVLNTSTPISGTTTSTGAIPATSIPDNNQINPGSTQWLLKVCSATIPQTCFSSAFTITGASQVLTVTPPSISIPVPTTPTLVSPVIAYADTEITGGWVGFTYYNIGLGSPRICQIVVSRNCLVWVSSAGSVAPAQTLSANISPPAINFGTVQTATPSPVQYAAISNAGTGTIVVTVTLSGSPDFASTQPTVCNGPLLPGATCPFPITFTPSSGVAKSAVLNINAGTVSLAAITIDACGLIGTSTTVNLCGSGTAAVTFPLSFNCDPLATGSGTTTSDEATPLINFHCAANGVLTGVASNNYANGSTPILTAIPDALQTFTTFSGSGCGTTSPSTITVSAAKTCTASFAAPLPTFTINIVGLGQGTNTITSNVNDNSGAAINCTSSAGILFGKCSGVFNQNTAIIFTETPLAGSAFVTWAGSGSANCTTATTCPITVVANQTISVNSTLTAVPISLVQTSSSCNTATANHIKCTFASAMNAGDFIILGAEWGDLTTTVSSVTDTKGNSYTVGVALNTQSSFSQVVYYAQNIAAAAAGANTVDMTLSANPASRDIRALEYAGIITAGNPVDVSNVVKAAGSHPTANNVTTTVAGDLLTGFFAATGSFVASTGYVQQLVDNGGNDEEDQQNAGTGVAIGTYNFIPTTPGTPNWMSINVGWKGQGATGSNKFSLTALCGGSGSGTAQLPGGTLTCTNGAPSGISSVQVASGSTATVTESALAGSAFVGWSGVTGCTSNPSCSVPNITSNTTLTVTFNLAGVQAYFVNGSTGNNANSGLCAVAGTPAGCSGPWATLAKADTAHVVGASGTIIHVADGTYTTTGLILANGGTSPSVRVRWQCDNGLASAIAAIGHCQLTGTGISVLQVTANNLDILGFDVGNNANAAACIISLPSTTTGPSTTGNSVYYIGNYCHDFGSNVTNRAGVLGCPQSSSLTMGGHGGPMTDSRFLGNIVLNVGKGQAGPYSPTACTTGQGLYTDNPSSIIENNIVVNVPMGGIQVSASCGQIISNNVLINSTNGIIMEDSDAATNCPGGVMGNNSVVNNYLGAHTTHLFYLGLPPRTICTVSTPNLFANNVTDGVGTDHNGNFACDTYSPSPFVHQAGASFFTNYLTTSFGTYTEKVGSVGINAGTTQCAPRGAIPCTPSSDFVLINRPQGPAIDIGAYEQ